MNKFETIIVIGQNKKMKNSILHFYNIKIKDLKEKDIEWDNRKIKYYKNEVVSIYFFPHLSYPLFQEETNEDKYKKSTKENKENNEKIKRSNIRKGIIKEIFNE